LWEEGKEEMKERQKESKIIIRREEAEVKNSGEDRREKL
jgi:hypothetical protein